MAARPTGQAAATYTLGCRTDSSAGCGAGWQRCDMKGAAASKGFGVTVFAAVLCACVSPLASAQSTELDMVSAVRRVVSWHPAVAAAIGYAREREERIKIARAGYLPRIRAGVRSEYDNNESDRQIQRATISASQMLFDFGKVSSSVEAAQAAAQAERARVWLAVDDVALDTLHAIIEIQRTRALLGIAQEQVKGVSAIVDLARKRSELGASARSDEVQARAREEAARATELEITARLDRWRGSLAALLGQPQAAPPDVAADVPPWWMASCRIDQPSWADAPALQAAEADTSEARALSRNARAHALPTLSLDAELNHALNHSIYRRQDILVGLNVSMDLYQGGAQRSRALAAGHALRAAEASADRARFSLARDLAEARDQTAGLSQSLEVLGARERTIAETRDLYRHQYLSLGTRSLLDLLNAEQELHLSRFDRVNTVHDLRRLQADCLYSSGLLRERFGLNQRSIQGGDPAE